MAILDQLRTHGSYVCVVGGANVDIEGRANHAILGGDSNMGSVTQAPGGVGRNVAENLARLGVETRLISAVGQDPAGDWLVATTSETGVNTDDVVRMAHPPTATYLSVIDPTGDMVVAINDMAILEAITPTALAETSGILSEAALVVCDANLTSASLAWLAENLASWHVPLFIDPVSVAKAPKLLPILPKVHMLKPNAMEAGVLTGTAVVDLASAQHAAKALVDAGVTVVALSMGANGVVYATRSQAGTINAHPADVVSVTGAGDALMAGLVRASLDAATIETAVTFATAAAALATESASTVSASMNASAVRSRLE